MLVPIHEAVALKSWLDSGNGTIPTVTGGSGGTTGGGTGGHVGFAGDECVHVCNKTSPSNGISNGTTATANTGSGGGGGAVQSKTSTALTVNGGAGGSGIVVIRTHQTAS